MVTIQINGVITIEETRRPRRRCDTPVLKSVTVSSSPARRMFRLDQSQRRGRSASRDMTLQRFTFRKTKTPFSVSFFVLFFLRRQFWNRVSHAKTTELRNYRARFIVTFPRRSARTWTRPASRFLELRVQSTGGPWSPPGTGSVVVRRESVRPRGTINGSRSTSRRLRHGVPRFPNATGETTFCSWYTVLREETHD